jgi:hypothetical protein
MVSNWPENMNRVVTLIESYHYRGLNGWKVEDGKPFKGYGIDSNGQTHPTIIVTHDVLGIEQWKLRKLDEDEPVETDADGIRHVVTA